MHRRLSLVVIAFLAGTLFLAGPALFGQKFRPLSFPSPVPYFHSKTHISSAADDAVETSMPKDAYLETISETHDPNLATPHSFSYANTLTASASTEKTTSSAYTYYSPSSLYQPSTTKPRPAKSTATSEYDQSSPDEEKVDTAQRILNVAITESMGAHDEVVAALVHSFGSQENVQISGLFQSKSRWGMPEIMDNFTLSHPPLPKNKDADGFNRVPANDTSPSTSPDILVISTCELDMLKFRPRLNVLLKQRKTHIFCVIHHADRWHTNELKQAVIPWLKAGLFDFVALSAHTAEYLETQGLNDWDINITSPVVFPPIFPVSLPPAVPEPQKAFALQGNYEATRRDFNTIFSHLQSFINASSSVEDEEQGNVTLRLLGSGQRPKVPGDLAEHVFFDEGLSYKDYYAVLSQTFALLPAFANDEYLSFKASSTIPASLLAGTPLVATKEILAAYSYVPEEAVYMQKDEETELEVIAKVLKASSKERQAKKALVRGACTKILDDNVKLIAKWLAQAVAKIDQ